MAKRSTPAPSGERVSSWWDAMRASFGFLPGIAMVVGFVLAFGMSTIDDLLGVELPLLLEFGTGDPARGVLETIATVTVAVAGVAFSITVVAFTLASNQLSPRVLRTFRRDRTSQATLALLLGTFIYCLGVLVRFGADDDADQVPDLSVTLAVLLGFASLALFAVFIAHIVSMLQPSSIIASIADDARGAVERPFPAEVGQEPEDPEAAKAVARERAQAAPGRPVVAEDEGYLTLVMAEPLVSAAREHGALVVQRARVGDYVLPGDALAEVWARDEGEELVERLRGAFRLGRQRTTVQDVAFPIRQLADIALKGLSPGVNDPTTAENAMGALTATLVRFLRGERPSAARVDEDGEVRFVALGTTFDDLLRLGFDQVRVFAAGYPVTTAQLLDLLARLEREARAAGVDVGELQRQARLLSEAPEGEVPTPEDAERVRRAHARLHHPDVL